MHIADRQYLAAESFWTTTKPDRTRGKTPIFVRSRRFRTKQTGRTFGQRICVFSRMESTAGHDPEQLAARFVGKQIQKPIGAFAYIANALADIGQQFFFAHDLAVT